MRIRTGFSFRTAVGTIPAVLDALQKTGHDCAPITDRNSTFGWVKWEKECRKRNLPPAFGVELGVVESFNEKKPTIDYWTFIAKDDVSAVNELVGLATQQFRYEPLLTYRQALSAHGVIRIMGYRSRIDVVKRILQEEKEAHTNHLFCSLAPSTARGYAQQVIAMNIPFMACSDNRYPTPEDRGFYEVVTGRNSETHIYDQHIQSMEEWRSSVGKSGLTEDQLAGAWANRSVVNVHCKAKLKKATLLKPKRPATLLKMCQDGAAKICCNLDDKVYSERLARELELIKVKGYEDYFYIVADICQWARERMLVGPARGSSCGSLVCYLLGITTVDPIPYGLIFERFIDINRDDLPDIDIDFSDQSRQMVFDYITQIYGSEHVARLGTVAMYKARSALQEAGTALKIPRWMCDAVSESLIERSTGDSRALNTLEDTLATMPSGQSLVKAYPEVLVAAKMEGHPRHYSQHAAGVVISEQRVSEIVAVDHRTGATMCDKKDAEELNLLKIDALGLTQLSVFEDTLEMAGLKRNFLDTLPLDSQEAFNVINAGKFTGIFQFNGLALQGIARSFKTTEFNDIVSVTALARPGPLASGGASEWIRRRNGDHPVTYLHPIFEPYLKDTLGIVLYQEQVMEIGRNIGGLDWGQVTALRKAMSKSLGKEYFDQFGDPWKRGAIAKGVDPKDADKVWDDLCAYGAWSFNKSHSVAYGLISYYCAYLKAHHPFEFAAATLSHENDVDQQIKLLREMVDEGYSYIPIDPAISDIKWRVGHRDGAKILVGPLSVVKGVGPKTVSAILSARKRGEPLPDKAAKLLANAKTTIDTIWPIRDAFRRLLPDPRARNIFTPPTQICDIKAEKNEYEVLVLATFSRINPRDENEAVNVAKRGHRIEDGLTTSLNLQISDDTGTIFGKVNRWKFESLGRQIVEKGRPGKSLYAVKGSVWGNDSFKMLKVAAVRYIGEIDEDQVAK